MELEYNDIPEADRPPPPDYLIWAILVTVLCCQVLGIVALVYSAQVKKKWASGDLIGAQEASRMARIWTLLAAVIGVILLVICFVVVQLYFVDGGSGF